jgi:hypothetical protein
MSVRCPVCMRVVPEATGYCPRCGASLNVPLRLRWVARLFWACPECQRDAPLVAQQPLFGGARLGCRACGAAWQLDPQARTLARLDPQTRQFGPARPLEEWLALLPPPFSGLTHPAPGLLLLPTERCHLRIDRARMLAPRQSVQHAQSMGRVSLLPGIYERVGRDPLGPRPGQLNTLARGPFIVTDRRIVFLGDRKHVESALNRLEGVEVDEGYLLLHRATRTDTFRFEDESTIRVRAAILALQAAIVEAERARELPDVPEARAAQVTRLGDAEDGPAAAPPAHPAVDATGTGAPPAGPTGVPDSIPAATERPGA